MKQKQQQFYVSYERDEKGGYIASAPAIRGCVVYGKTLKEAYSNICSAIKECLEVIAEFNKQSPRETITPSAIQKFSFVQTPEYA